MKYNKKYFILYKDMFNIYNRVREINQGYRLYFNLKDKKYYIVNVNKNYEICYIFETFFKDILNDLRFSKIENFCDILTKIDNYNSNLENKIIEKNKQNTIDKIKEINYISNRSKFN